MLRGIGRPSEKRRLWFAALFMALVAAVILAACGGGGGSSTTSSEATTTEESTEPAETAETEPPEASDRSRSRIHLRRTGGRSRRQLDHQRRQHRQYPLLVAGRNQHRKRQGTQRRLGDQDRSERDRCQVLRRGASPRVRRHDLHLRRRRRRLRDGRRHRQDPLDLRTEASPTRSAKSSAAAGTTAASRSETGWCSSLS